MYQASVSWMVFFMRRYFLLLRIKRAAESEAQEWKEKASHLTEGLSQAIDAQFDKWNFTSTEREVALLLATVVIGGIISATVLTLLVLPLVYRMILKNTVASDQAVKS